MKQVSVVLAGVLAFLIGDVTALAILLAAAMAIDMVTGIFAAGLKGEVSSGKGFIGIARKFCILLIVVLANRIDVYLGAGNYLRDASMIFYIINEVISITENMGALGVKMPDAIKNALDALSKEKTDG